MKISVLWDREFKSRRTDIFPSIAQKQKSPGFRRGIFVLPNGTLPAAAACATTAVTAAIVRAGSARLHRFGFIDRQLAAAEVLTVPHVDRFRRRPRHFPSRQIRNRVSGPSFCLKDRDRGKRRRLSRMLSRSSSSVVEYGKPPTYNFLAI